MQVPKYFDVGFGEGTRVKRRGGVPIELKSVPIFLHRLLNCHFALSQSNLTFKWQFNNTLETVVELPALMLLSNVASVGDLAGPDHHPFAQSLHGAKSQHQHSFSGGYNSIEKQSGKVSTGGSHRYHHHQQQQGNGHHRNQQLRNLQREENLNSGHLYPYKIDTFSNFGTVTCYAENSFGNSGPCYYHILAAGMLYLQLCGNTFCSRKKVAIICNYNRLWAVLKISPTPVSLP